MRDFSEFVPLKSCPRLFKLISLSNFFYPEKLLVVHACVQRGTECIR